MSNEHSHKHEENSMDEVGGVAVGFTGYITNFNADAQARMVNALNEVGKWVQEKAGTFLGHIKCAIYLEDGSGVTINLTDLDSGVEIHGTLEPAEKVGFSLLCAVLDVEKSELGHTVHHALDDTFLDIELIDHDCQCNDHNHKHDHHDKHEHDCCGKHEHCDHSEHHHDHK